MPDGSATVLNEMPLESTETKALQSGDVGYEQTTQKQTQDDGFPVARIKEGGKDIQGRGITRVYAMRSGQYAVYLAGDVRIEYADDPEEETAQRACVVSSIGKARAEITSLLVGWGPDQRRVYDHKVAMSLELALEKTLARSRVERTGPLVRRRSR